MKAFEQIMTSGGYYVYEVYKITDYNGQPYYEAVPLQGGGVTRISESKELLQKILDKDAKIITEFKKRIH